MGYVASFSYQVGNYTISWREWFTSREEAVEALESGVEAVKRHFSGGDVKKIKKTVRKAKD